MERLKLETIENIIGIQKTTLDAFEKHGSEDTDYIPTLDKCILSAMEELKKYRIAEEQGLLLRLPCKVGQTVWSPLSMSGWYLRKKDAPYQAKIVFIGLNDSEEDGGGFFYVCYEKNTYMMSFRFSDIGKTVFFTKEEAEQALERMEKENEKIV